MPLSETEKLSQVRAYAAQCEPLRSALGIPRDAALSVRLLGMGEHNENYLVSVEGDARSFVVRVNVAQQPFHRRQAAYEFSALRALSSSGRVPRPYVLDESKRFVPYDVLIIGFCEGLQLDYDAPRPGELACAMQLLADIHAVPVSDECSLHRPADPLAELFEECCQRLAAYRFSGFAEKRLTTWAEHFCAKTAAAVDATQPDCARLHIVNTEPLASHFLIPDSAARCANESGLPVESPGSFVDWERPIIGEPAQDLAYALAPTTTFWDSDTLLSPEQAASCIDLYWRAVDGRFARGSFEQRYEAYRMVSVLRSVTWCLRAIPVYRGHVPGHTTKKTAAKLPVYLSEEFMEMIARECFGL